MSPGQDRLIKALLDERDRRIAAEDELRAARRREEILNAKLIELSSDATIARQLREAYRRGYMTGHTAGRQGRARADAPEDHARGELGERLRSVGAAA